MGAEIVVGEVDALARRLATLVGVAMRESADRLSIALPGGSTAEILLPPLAATPLDLDALPFLLGRRAGGRPRPSRLELRAQRAALPEAHRRRGASGPPHEGRRTRPRGRGPRLRGRDAGRSWATLPPRLRAHGHGPGRPRVLAVPRSPSASRRDAAGARRLRLTEAAAATDHLLPACARGRQGSVRGGVRGEQGGRRSRRRSKTRLRRCRSRTSSRGAWARPSSCSIRGAALTAVSELDGSVFGSGRPAGRRSARRREMALMPDIERISSRSTSWEARDEGAPWTGTPSAGQSASRTQRGSTLSRYSRAVPRSSLVSAPQGLKRDQAPARSRARGTGGRRRGRGRPCPRRRSARASSLWTASKTASFRTTRAGSAALIAPSTLPHSTRTLTSGSARPRSRPSTDRGVGLLLRIRATRRLSAGSESAS